MPQQRAISWPVILAGGLAVYVGGLLWFSRFHMLDDALIHLRFAELLIETGTFTGGRDLGFGPSSPLFATCAAALHAVFPSDLTTKILSVAFYLVLIGGLSALAWRETGLRRAAWTTLLALAITPMGVRWLTDGMETSLAAVLAIALGLLCHAPIRQLTARIAAAMFVLGLLAITARVEMTALIGLIALSAWLTGPARLTRLTPLLAGAMIGLFVLWIVFGTVIPDAAVAKAAGVVAPVDALAAMFWSFGGALVFGIGLLALWLATLAGAFAHSERRAAVIVPNLVLVLFWAVVAARGQYIQGIRPLVAIMAFMIAANIAVLPAIALPSFGALRASHRASLAVALAAIVAAELVMFQPIVARRSDAFLAMRALNLAPLEGTSGIGWDIGHLMYFTKAQVCDVSGIVNGRAAAQSRETARLEACLHRDVEFIFATPEQARELIGSSGGRFADWPVCGPYVFQNVLPTAPHYLAVAPTLAGQVCPQLRDDTRRTLVTLRSS